LPDTIRGYDKEELVKSIYKKQFVGLEKFALDAAGNGKIYKLRQILAEFDPVHLSMYMVGVCGRQIRVKLNSFDFPDGEHRVGIEFIEVIKRDDDLEKQED